MVRSFMLSLVMKKTSFTSWSEELKTNPLAAIISGFHPDDTPGVGTFYDFCDRLWISDKDNLSDHAQPPKIRKIEKPKNLDDKAPPVEDITVEDLIPILEKNPLSDDQPYARLFQIFFKGLSFFPETKGDSPARLFFNLSRCFPGVN